MKTCCQVYVKGSLEAAEIYCKAFNLTLNPDMTFFNENGTYEHVSLMFGETEVLAVAEDVTNKIINTKSVMAFNFYDLGSREAVDHAFSVLNVDALFNENPNGPKSPFWDSENNEYWFSLVDKFGVYWGVGK